MSAPVTGSPGPEPDGIANPPDAAPAGSPTQGGFMADNETPAVDFSVKKELDTQVQEVLASDIGVSTMLNRLKQSISSAKEFALFLKKRSTLEDEHAKGLKKICRSTGESAHHSDHKQGSFSHAYDEMLHIHDRMAENGLQFALSLHQMHEDLLEVAAVSERHRKSWKVNGLEPENRLAAVESAMRKSKTKYDSLAEEYERVRTGEGRHASKFGFKGHKSAQQQEEELLRKVQAADTDYLGKVQHYQSEKANVETSTRPDAVRALHDLIRECDAGTTLQMQKFASFNEKLLLSNGLVISPLKNASLPGQQAKSLKEVIQGIENNQDFESHIKSFHGQVTPKGFEPKYERNPVLNPHSSAPNYQPSAQAPPTSSQPPQFPQSPPQLPQLQTQTSPLGSMATRTGGFDSFASTINQQGPSQGFGGGSGSGPPSAAPGGHERSVSHGGMLSQGSPQPQQPFNVRNSTHGMPPAQNRFNGGGSGPSPGPPQLGALPFQTQTPVQSAPSVFSEPSNAPQVAPSNTSPIGRGKQVFGVNLTRLYQRDGLAVPMIVNQCIQAVNLYGLNVEGIYRLSGSATHVNKLKNLFDTDSESSILDFRNPENFFHDVNSVAGLLKQFFRDLPDPLLTAEHYQNLIEAAKHEDDIVRRDSLHAIINDMPDPNYATLRALMLHLHRVTEASSINRMNSQNLAIVFGPTLLGTAPGSNIADAGWQVRVVDTILNNTYQIFDED
ncbi:Rho GTPase-activating protein RGD1 [Microdochium nivale]|nr:Rho GTPase-activating protein RGD1 [Microdochium nivale]